MNGVKPVFYTDLDSNFIKEVQLLTFQLLGSLHYQFYRAVFFHVARGNSTPYKLANLFLSNFRSRDKIELGADQC